MLDAYAWVKRVMTPRVVTLSSAHDPDVYKAHKHSPEYTSDRRKVPQADFDPGLAPGIVCAGQLRL